MKRYLVAACVSLAVAAVGCGERPPKPTPKPSATHEITGRIMGPADKAQDVVDQLEQRNPGDTPAP